MIQLHERRTFSLGEVSGLTGLCVATLYSLISRGHLKSIKVGGRRLITTEALNQLLSSDERGAASSTTCNDDNTA
jgi:excisionase family DNA binding protein